MLQIRFNATRAKTVVILFIVSIVIGVCNIGALLWYYLILRDWEKSPDNETFVLSSYVQAGVSILSLILTLVTLIYFIRWFRRAYFNLHATGSASVSFSEGWAAGCWFVPFLNFVRPFQIMKEIWNGTQQVIAHRLLKIESSAFVGIWWALYLINTLYSTVLARVMPDSTDPGELAAQAQYQMVGELLAIGTCVLGIVLVKKTMVFENELWEEAQTPSDSVFSLEAESRPQL